MSDVNVDLLPSMGEYEEVYGVLDDAPPTSALTRRLAQQDVQNRKAESMTAAVEVVRNSEPSVPTLGNTLTLAADPYVGVSAVPFDEKAQKVLAQYQEVPDEWVD